MKWEDYLQNIYFDTSHAGSYGSAKKLQRAIRNEGRFEIGLGQIKKWLAGQETYTTMRSSRKKFPRNRVIVYGINDQWDTDLMDMADLAKENDGVKFVLVAIDVLSRQAQALPQDTRYKKFISQSNDMYIIMYKCITEYYYDYNGNGRSTITYIGCLPDAPGKVIRYIKKIKWTK